MILGYIRFLQNTPGTVLLVENDFWGRKKRNLNLFDYKSGFIEAPFFLRCCTRTRGKFPLILWAIYA
jgi:hypothetical protein